MPPRLPRGSCASCLLLALAWRGAASQNDAQLQILGATLSTTRKAPYTAGTHPDDHLFAHGFHEEVKWGHEEGEFGEEGELVIDEENWIQVPQYTAEQAIDGNANTPCSSSE
eukprot:6819106-Prymnesium_polylepis.1